MLLIFWIANDSMLDHFLCQMYTQKSFIMLESPSGAGSYLFSKIRFGTVRR